VARLAFRRDERRLALAPGARPRSPPGSSARSGSRPGNRSASASSTSWGWSRRAARTVRPPPACSSARPRSRPTYCTSTPSWASTTAPPRWRPGSSGACCPGL